MSSVSVAYISASTNRHPHAADVSTQSVIAFGAAKFIALWNATNAQDEFDRGVYETLPGHDGTVTCVRYVQEDCLLSADDKAHEKAISALAVHDRLVVSGSSDSRVKIWELSLSDQSIELKEIQLISLRGKYPLSFALTVLPGVQAIILAIGSTDRNIQIWTRSEDLFVSSAVLSGHEDWVRSLAFRQPLTDEDPLILASGSQDATIRLWNIEAFTKKNTDILEDDNADDFSTPLRHHLQNLFSITFDALLVGHEASITSLSWRPRLTSTSTPTLLSTSTDSSLILWQRFGDIGGQRLGGFVGGLWASSGMDALAWGWSGGWRRWRCAVDDNNCDWSEVGAIGGHSAAVRGLAWSPGGEYLMSCGLDQTTRIHGEIPIPGALTSQSVWHEIGRPQVHGYDLSGVAFLDALRFVSIADEKVARVFEAPREFVDVVNNIGSVHLTSDKGERPRAATVPPLGLSNKATSEATDASAVDPQLTGSSSAYDTARTKRRPFEGELAAITLWPEIEKVFGHGYESIALAVSNSRTLVATACKATSPEHAVIRVYDTAKWQLVGQPLVGHSLTVTRIAFSSDDRYILSVSRDRSWRLFERQGADGGYVPVTGDKSHSRIIWDCAWAPEGDIFATASRDKTVRIWHSADTGKPGDWLAVTTIKTSDAATAVAFAPSEFDSRRRLAIGLESGHVLIYSSHSNISEWRLDLTVDSRTAHVDQIHHLIWRPYSSNATMQLASCSEDSTLKVLTVHNATG
ncbi:WD40 repeat-like protein [Amylocystis lapponica]|nr:WD40 repeat-like protein [Amylocystis lapponica]